MKRTYIAFAVLAMAALLVSCQENEFKEDTYVPGKGEIVFRLTNNSKQTKSSDITVKGVTVDLGISNGNNYFLEETVTNLDQMAYGPETKGTPAYTENFATLYKDFKGAAFKTTSGSFETSAFDDGVFEKVGDNLWKRQYEELKESLPLYFFLRAPYAQEGTTVTNLSYNTGTGAISFKYDGSSLTSAADQKDLLFTSRKVESGEYSDMTNKGKGIPILFHHALTGVKFAIGNDEDDQDENDIAITSVVFKGLYDSGNCVITPTKENNKYEDDTDIYSSASTTAWTASSLAASDASKSTGFSSGTYGTPVDYESGDLPESFYAAGNMQNLNDADVTQTFWFVPQALARTETETPVTLTITYDFGTNKGLTWEINLSDVLSSVTWKAGELRTYTIRIDDVNVKIDDTVTPGTGEDKIVGSKKDAVTITNTGNTDAFIRAAIVGQWVIDKTVDGKTEREIMFGFTDEINNLYEVESWYEDQFVTHKGEHGVFDGLAGYVNNNTATQKSFSNPYPETNGWFYKDGYYYFTKSVKPGAATDTPLFNSYTISKIPHATNGGVIVSPGMYFTLEIATQAISARNSDGTLKPDSDYYNAWVDALAIDEE